MYVLTRTSPPSATPLAADHVLSFRFLQGDANNDGRVNLDDFNALAANFGQGPRDYSQGDFNYSGSVNLDDFNILAARFGQILAAAGTAAQQGGTRQNGIGGASLGDVEDPLDELLA